MPSDILKRATDYWSDKRRGLRMPARRAIDPIELADVLANLVVVEAIDGGRDYMHRIAGERAEELLGAEMHGARLSRLARSKASFAAWRDGLNAARAFKAPHFAAFDMGDGGGPIRAVFLPLVRKDGDEQADFVLSAIIADARPRDAG